MPRRHALRPTVRCAPRAFTLIEVMIVVVIIAILAVVTIPSFGNLTEESARAAFASNLKSYARSAEVYAAQNRRYPADGTTGSVPAGMEDLVDPTDFARITPIGGRWDFEYLDNGITAGVGVHFDGSGQTRDDFFMALLDAEIDDGNLATGAFREIAPSTRYYYVLAE